MTEKVKTVIECFFLLPDFKSRGHPTDRFLKDEMSVQMDQNDNDYSLAQIDGEKPLENARPSDKVPMFIHLSVDQINEMQEEKNSNFDFSQNVYVNLNSACNLESITQLVVFLFLTLM